MPNSKFGTCPQCGGERGRHNKGCPSLQGRNKSYTRSAQKGRVSPRERKQLTQVDCPTCRGSGKRGNRDCGLCKGSGKVDAAK